MAARTMAGTPVMRRAAGPLSLGICSAGCPADTRPAHGARGGDALTFNHPRNTHVRFTAPLARGSPLAPTLPVPGRPPAAVPPAPGPPMPAAGATGGPPGPVGLQRLDPGRWRPRLAPRRRRP